MGHARFDNGSATALIPALLPGSPEQATTCQLGGTSEGDGDEGDEHSVGDVHVANVLSGLASFCREL